MLSKIILILAVVSLPTLLPAYGDNSNIPGSLLSSRDRAQALRARMLDGRADNMRCWSDDEMTLASIDKAMAMDGSAETKKRLAAYRANRMSCIANHKATIATIEKSVIDNDRDLANVESQITRYACMR